ncbi:MAG: host attachment protein [Gammaproteobacteria bacterium]|jgi:protein required for attachment to host cells|nr:host attachment protein [Gammaproteobacteria bacterium]
MNKYWIVVADASRARLFARRKKFSPLEEVESLVHPESRLRRQDLVSDRPGQVQESRTPGEYAAEEGTDPKEVEAQTFARELARRLHEAHAAGEFEHLVLLAEPHFLGQLRKRLDGRTASAVVARVAVNLTREDIAHITKRADSALESPD